MQDRGLLPIIVFFSNNDPRLTLTYFSARSIFVEYAYKKEGKLYLACNDKKAFFTSAYNYRGYHLWSFQNVCGALSFLLDNIYIRFGTKLYRQIVGIPMGTHCAPLVADLFLFCYERDFMKNLFSDNQADVIKAFNLTSRYLDDLLNIHNPYFEGMVNQIYLVMNCN